MKHHLPDHQEVITNAIAHIAGTCKIYLLGVANELQSYSIFSHWRYPNAGCRHKATAIANAYFLLVLIDAEGPRSIHVIREKIEHLSLRTATIVPWVMSRFKFELRLNSNDYFAYCVHNNAILWHNTMPGVVLNNIYLPNHPYALVKPIHDEAAAFAQRAHSLLAGVELYMNRKEPALAALLLHQSAEQLFTALIFAQTGYRPQSHNVERLYQYACFVCPALAEMRQHETPEFISQLLQLSKAYLEARYGSNKVSESTLRTLTERLYQLHPITTGTIGIACNAA